MEEATWLSSNVKTGNGYEALRQLMAMFALKSQGRSLGILTAITQVPAFKQNEALLPQVLELERVEYESASSEAIQDCIAFALLRRTRFLQACLKMRPIVRFVRRA